MGPPPRRPLDIFEPNQLLSYPLFETYRLAAHPTQSDVTTWPLPSDHQSTVGSQVEGGTGFKEAKKRVEWNALYTGTREDEVLFVDAGYNVVGVRFQKDQDTLVPKYSTLASLTIPISTSSSKSAPANEVPSLAAIPKYDAILASSGGGDLSVIRLIEGDMDAEPSGTINAEYELRLPDLGGESNEEEVAASSPPSPFLIHAATESPTYDSPKKVQAILSRTVRRLLDPVAQANASGNPAPPRSTLSSRPKTETSFEVICVDIDLDRSTLDGAVTQSLDVKWRLKSEELPKYFHPVKRDGGAVIRWIVGGPAVLEDIAASTTTPGAATHVHPASSSTATAEGSSQPVSAPYEWFQTSTSINVIFRVPLALQPSRDIVCLLRPHTIDLQLYARDGTSLSIALKTWLEKAGKMGRRDWWDAIKPDESTWTFEKPTDLSKGADARLEVHLEKANPGTKWPSVFAPWIELDDEETVEEDEVHETVSDEAMAETVDRLQQYTSEFGQKGAAEGAGIGASLPGLMREEMEDEDDIPDGLQHSAGAGYGSSAKAGKELVITYIDAKDGGVKISSPTKGTPATVLSYPLTLLNDSTEDGVMIKTNVDGSLFSPPADYEISASWKHLVTAPALSFVLSSKRETQFVYHFYPKGDTGPTVFAFESRQASGMGGNVYIYYPVSNDLAVGKTASGKSKATSSKQSVVKFGVADDSNGLMDLGSLVGVKAILVDKEPVLVGLCEKALVALTHIWGSP